MGMRKGVRKVEVWIHLDDMRLILAKAKADNISENRALSAIVQEWGRSKEIEPIKTPPKLSDLALLENKLRECQKTIEELRKELKLAKL